MNLEFSSTFAELYEDLPGRDLIAIHEMLDWLLERRDQAEMRNIIVVGDVALFATPRIYAPDGVYRITWQYGQGSIVCITVASLET